jgi:hypothetical protein
MRVIVTVFKTKLSANSSLFRALSEMSFEIGEADENYTFSPKPGKLFDFLNLLKDNSIDYKTRFDVTDEHSTSEA